MGKRKDRNSYYHCENCNGGTVVLAPKGGFKPGRTATGAAMGAVVGSIVPVVGTALGAVVGGALGAGSRRKSIVAQCMQCGALYSVENLRLLKEKAVPIGGLTFSELAIPTDRSSKDLLKQQVPNSLEVSPTQPVIFEIDEGAGAKHTNQVAQLADTLQSISTIAGESSQPLQAKTVPPHDSIPLSDKVNQDGCLTILLLGGAFAVVLILVAIGMALTTTQFWIAVGVCITAAVIFRKRKYVNAVTITIFALSCIIVFTTQGARHKQVNQDRYLERQAANRKQREEAAHEQRLKYNNAHPREVAAKRNAAIAKAQADERAQNAAKEQDAEYIARVNKYINTTIDHTTYSKAILTSEHNIDWYVSDPSSITGSVEDQILENNYRKSFLHMVSKDNPGLRITHQRFLDAQTGNLLPGASDEDVDYNLDDDSR